MHLLEAFMASCYLAPEELRSLKDAALDFPSYRFFIVLVADGFGTPNEKVLNEVTPHLIARLPLSSCLVASQFLPKECSDFKNFHKLKGLSGPLIFISEDNPFDEPGDGQRVVIQLGTLQNSDDVRKVVASIAEQAHDDDFIRKAKKGEIVRRIGRALGKYGQPIKDCLSLLGI